MKTPLSSLIATFGLTAALASLAFAATSEKTVVITANDSMRFNVTRIDAQPGQKIHVQLKNEGSFPKEVMAHNWVLLRSGQSVTSYAAAATSARDQGYEPKSLANEVLASIPLVGAGQTGDVTFDAPTEPGVYPYLCSFPAHCQIGMHGELIVR